MKDARFKGLIDLQERIRAGSGDLQAIMEAVVAEYSVMPQSNGIVVELRDADQVYYAAASGTSDALVGLRLPLNASLSGMCILTGRPLYCEDSETDSRVNRAACRRVNLRSMVVVPIPHRGQTVGVLKYYAADPAAFTDEDMMLAHLLVGPLAVGFSMVGEADAEKVSTELRELIAIRQHFVATVTHELRSPLTAITGALTLLTRGATGPLDPRVQSTLGIAARNADRMKRLVDDLLTFEKIKADAMALEIRQVDLADVLRTAVSDARPNAELRGVTLTLHTVEPGTLVLADKERFLQAVNNLISNAVKFSPSGGEVSVSIRLDGDEASVRVKDQGPGVSEAFRKRLFQPFAQDVTTPSDVPSTGLGLAITRSLIEQMGGTVRLGEHAGTGAVFEILMPVVNDLKMETSPGSQAVA
jgi:signal transduction histidine kinase